MQIHFAPLQGYTEDIYRRLHNNICGGIDYYYTPFIRIEHGKVRTKDILDMRPQHNAGMPLILQAIASDAKELDSVLKTITEIKEKERGSEDSWANKNTVAIDINMGCPFPLQVKHGRGAGILTNPDRVKEICDYINHHTEFAFSVKMRLGNEQANDWRNVLPMLNDSNISHITLHPRIAKQQYGGVTDMAEFEAFMNKCKHPLIYNGDITSISKIKNLETHYPELHGVMIGRGLLARPTLAWEYREGREKTIREVTDILLKLHESYYENYASRIPGESQLLNKVRTFWDYTENTIGRKAWKKIHKAGNLKNYLAAVADLT